MSVSKLLTAEIKEVTIIINESLNYSLYRFVQKHRLILEQNTTSVCCNGSVVALCGTYMDEVTGNSVCYLKNNFLFMNYVLKSNITQADLPICYSSNFSETVKVIIDPSNMTFSS